MARFYDTFDVVVDDGATWTRGENVDTLGCGFTLINSDICSPGVQPTPPDYGLGELATPFAIIANQVVPTRCAPEYVGQFVEQAMERATEYQITKALWDGVDDVPEHELFLTHSDVTEVARTGDVNQIIGTVLETAYAQMPFLSPVIHLGFQVAMSLQFGLNNIGIPYVIAPGYPRDAVAVTGPVQVKLTKTSYTQSVDPKDNREYFQASRLALIEFDPCQAVRAAASA